MVVDVVVYGPQEIERRYCDEQASIRFKKAERVSYRRVRLFQMFQHVEHKNETVLFRWLERGVKRADMDPVPVGSVSWDQMTERFQTLHRAELREGVKEQSIATTDVEERPERSLPF